MFFIDRSVGITHLIITNAAGSLNEKYNVGDIMIIKDHVNLLSLAGLNPLRGPNESLFGPRFLAMNKAYDENLKKVALEIARELDVTNEVREGMSIQFDLSAEQIFYSCAMLDFAGVYACTGGPTYETVAEARLLKLLGADCVGMSTVHEVCIQFFTLRLCRVFFSFRVPFKETLLFVFSDYCCPSLWPQSAWN